MKAIHGGKAKHDQIDAHKIAVLRRGGMPPQAYVYPAEMRATSDLRRRMPLMRKRAELLAHRQKTNSQYHLPEIGKKLAYKANRGGSVERLPEPAGQKRIAVDLALIDYDDELLRDVDLTIVKATKPRDANTLSLLQTVPGIGKIRSRMLRYEIYDLNRFPRVPEFASSCRLVKCAKESHGKRAGSAGTQIGNAHLQWAFSEAAVLCLRDHPAGQHLLVILAKTHGKGTALTLLAHKLSRAVYYMLTRKVAFDTHRFLHD